MAISATMEKLPDPQEISITMIPTLSLTTLTLNRTTLIPMTTTRTISETTTSVASKSSAESQLTPDARELLQDVHLMTLTTKATPGLTDQEGHQDPAAPAALAATPSQLQRMSQPLSAASRVLPGSMLSSEQLKSEALTGFLTNYEAGHPSTPYLREKL